MEPAVEELQQAALRIKAARPDADIFLKNGRWSAFALGGFSFIIDAMTPGQFVAASFRISLQGTFRQTAQAAIEDGYTLRFEVAGGCLDGLRMRATPKMIGSAGTWLCAFRQFDDRGNVIAYPDAFATPAMIGGGGPCYTVDGIQYLNSEKVAVVRLKESRDVEGTGVRVEATGEVTS